MSLLDGFKKNNPLPIVSKNKRQAFRAKSVEPKRQAGVTIPKAEKRSLFEESINNHPGPGYSEPKILSRETGIFSFSKKPTGRLPKLKIQTDQFESTNTKSFFPKIKQTSSAIPEEDTFFGAEAKKQKALNSMVKVDHDQTIHGLTNHNFNKNPIVIEKGFGTNKIPTPPDISFKQKTQYLKNKKTELNQSFGEAYQAQTAYPKNFKKHVQRLKETMQ